MCHSRNVVIFEDKAEGTIRNEFIHLFSYLCKLGQTGISTYYIQMSGLTGNMGWAILTPTLYVAGKIKIHNIRFFLTLS